MIQPKVVMFSIWRNEMYNNLHDRAMHLISKSYPNMRFVWIVGDSTDETSYVLRYVKGVNKSKKDIEVIECNTGIVCEAQDYVERRKRISLTFNHFFDNLRDDDEMCFQHESDLITPVDITERLLSTGKCPVAGWPTLTRSTQIKQERLPPFAKGQETIKDTVFYDTFAYKKDGVSFTNEKPYHACYKPNELFEVDSVGSAYLFYAQDIRDGIRCYDEACVELCRKFKEKGRSIWVDPTIEVIQPEKLLSINRKD